MSLLHRVAGLRTQTPHRRKPQSFRPALYPTLDALEQRTVMSTTAAAVVAPAAIHSPLQITGATITNLAVTGANTLSGTLNIAANLVDKAGVATPITLPLPIELSLTPTGTTPDGCPILHLSLEIPDLNLLGLHVRLDDCSGDPLTVDITAIPSSEDGGGLLGDLLCSVSNLLNGSGGLLNLGGLTGGVTGALTQVLNGILTDLVTGTTSGTGGTIGSSSPGTDTIPAGDSELVGLHLGPINADVLGLQVTTSPICLNVFADPNGGLLGNLLSSLNNLLNNGGNNTQASQVLVRNILRDLQSLNL
jgi:hypothetical protein